MIVNTEFGAFNATEDTPLDFLIDKALPDLRQIVWHSNGSITAKTGANSAHPKKLYGGRKSVRIALAKLINDKSATHYIKHNYTKRGIK